MAKFRIIRISAVKDLSGGFGSASVSTESEISHDFLENIVTKAKTELDGLDDNNDTHLNLTLAIAIFEKKVIKIFGFIPAVREQLVWRESKTSKGALPVRIVA